MISLSDLTVRMGTFSAPIGPGAISTDGGPSASSDSTDAARAALNLPPQTTRAQQIRNAGLRTLGISDEQLKTMSSQEQSIVEDNLRDIVKQTVLADPSKANATGLIADIKV